MICDGESNSLMPLVTVHLRLVRNDCHFGSAASATSNAGKPHRSPPSWHLPIWRIYNSKSWSAPRSALRIPCKGKPLWIAYSQRRSFGNCGRRCKRDQCQDNPHSNPSLLRHLRCCSRSCTQRASVIAKAQKVDRGLKRDNGGEGAPCQYDRECAHAESLDRRELGLRHLCSGGVSPSR